jgi:hypothetical protein
VVKRLKPSAFYTGHTQKNGAVLIVNTIKTAPLFCVCPVYPTALKTLHSAHKMYLFRTMFTIKAYYLPQEVFVAEMEFFLREVLHAFLYNLDELLSSMD